MRAQEAVSLKSWKGILESSLAERVLKEEMFTPCLREPNSIVIRQSLT